MGKHSATDGPEGPGNGIPGGPGGFGGLGPAGSGEFPGPVGPAVPGRLPGGGERRPPNAPGTGRRRRGPAEESGYFTTLGEHDPDGPPSRPEHREHGAWGESGAWPTLPGRRGPSRDPVEEWAEDWAPYDAASARTSAAANAVPLRQIQLGTGRSVPRPRQEFLDAFDAPPEPPPVRPAVEAVPDPDPEPEPAPARGGAKGRTLSGVAAAAVVTVLAVVVGGQVHSAETRRHEGDSGDPGSTAGEVPAPTTAATATATAASYDTRMARQYPLDPKLGLSGVFDTVPGHQAAPGKGKVMRVRVDMERGLPLDGRLFAETVFMTLNDPRSWGHGGTMTFERVSSGPADIVITLASPGTTAKWCAKSGLDTSVENVSCDAASTPRTMINAYRWAQGAATYGPGRIHEYRQMLINHEVGHRLGHNHVGCPKQGAPAPVMMQQTKFLSLDGGPTCKPNAWPFP